MPGVIIRTATRSGPVNPDVPETGRYYVPGLFTRGSVTTPKLVRSVAELILEFGDRPTYSAAWDDLKTYFEEGGTEAVVTRVVGPAATTGTVSLPNATATATLRVDAASPGAWSSGVKVAVIAGRNAGTVAIEVTLGGQLVERSDNLTTPADAQAAFATSRYIKVTDLGTGSNPAPTAQPVALSAGVDDSAAVTAAMLTTALGRFGAEWGAGAVAVPGQAAATVSTALIAHAKATNRLALLAPAKGATEADVTTLSGQLASADGGENAGLFYPWITVPGPAAGTTITTSPEGYVAAARARAHREVGPWRAPGGEIAAARYVVDVERRITRAEGDRLDDAQVNAIRVIEGTVRLYGWRSLTTNVADFGFLTGRDVLNAVTVEAARRLEAYVFRPIDAKGFLLDSIAAELVGLVEPMRQAGGLYPRITDGTEVDPGYSVDVSEAINPAEQLNRNTIRAVLALRVSPVGALIDLTIVKAGMLAAV